MEKQLIPADWLEVTIGDVLTLQRGYDLPSRLRKIGNVPIISSAGAYDFHDAAKVKAPGVVTGRYGTIGDVFYIQEDFWPLNTTLYISDFKGNDPLYISYQLKTVDFESHSGKSGVPGINRNDIHQLIVLKPPVQEQTAIANALSDVDALIATLEKLINKKSAIKTAAMQQLLTGKKRLPPFDQLNAGYKQTQLGEIPGDWDVKDIGHFNPFVTSGSRGWANYYSSVGSLFVRITNMKRSSIYLDLTNNKYVSLPVMSAEGKRTELQIGDVLISITADVGISGYVDESIENPAYINQHIALVRFTDEKINSKFVSYYLASENIQKLFRGNTDQGAKAGMNLTAIRAIKFAVPTKPEQTAIANVLSDMDKDLEALQQRLHKTKQIKQGMMQELLTGKTRLVSTEAIGAGA